MANLNDPDVANSEVDDLDDRLLGGISDKNGGGKLSLADAIFYAARHWTTHVASISAMSSEFVEVFSRFCHDHIFHWLELLSLIRSLTHSIQSSLLAVIHWSTVRSFSPSLLPT
jgi:hypothetical protein